MIEVGQSNLSLDFIRRILDVGFPVRFSSGKVELLFVLQSPQRIQVGIAGLILDKVGKRRTGFARRTAKGHGASGQRHHAEEHGLQHA